MARWFLLLLVLLSFGLIGYGLCGRARLTFSKSVWGNFVPDSEGPLTYVSISRSSLDASQPLFNREPIAAATDTPLSLSNLSPGAGPLGDSAGYYVYLPIQGREAYAQTPLAERDVQPGIFDDSPNDIFGVWIPAGRHGFQPIDPKTKLLLPGSFALLVTGSRETTALLNFQWQRETSWAFFVTGSSLLAVVSLVLFAGVIVGWKVQPAIPDSIKSYAAHLTSESPPWWVISRSFGVMCILAGIIGMLASPIGSNAMERGQSSVLTIAMAFLGAPLGWLLLSLGAQLCQRNVAAVMRRRNRPPILYLRSFRADARWLEQPSDLIWMFLFPGRFETLERSLTKSLSGAGPLIAIGQPGEILPPMGAARLYVKHDKWQEVVAHLTKVSGLIVLRVGTTESFWWEVEHVVECCPPEKVVFLLPPANRFGAYDALASHLAPRLKKLFPRPTTDIQFVAFEKDWQPVLLSKRSVKLRSRFRQLLIGSAAPILRDELLPTLRAAGYSVGRLPLQFREWLLVLIFIGGPLLIAAVILWTIYLQNLKKKEVESLLQERNALLLDVPAQVRYETPLPKTLDPGLYCAAPETSGRR